ncbi:MAG: hypothetical protein A2Y10_16655 [Planctomycetes bacterium GWF2_41_51]|nr:MAG: hypothetical protein A2Y10_16655 [Planctomycetes bacterium GWF2_41_51]HBG28902.1 hypothetical protein [Phycisphaerales bacterium]
MSWFDTEKRQEDRRDPDSDDNREESEHQQEERRVAQRRQFFRVVYPINESPEIINLSAKIIDISVHAVKFELPAEAASKFNVDSRVELKIKFHDGQIVEGWGKIFQKRDGTGKSIFISIFEKEISSAVINKEQAYMLKNYPDFCRRIFKF